ncbi:MAG: DUF3187 family protein [Armatimonadetes bacterium]|nr:DUF3187 family protein [Armatimonadota bacterium]
MNVLLLAALCAFTPDNQADVGGPLRLRNEFPFQTIFLSTPPLDARIPRRARLDISLGVYNSFGYILGPGATQQINSNNAAGNPQPVSLGQVFADAAARPASTYYIADVETTKLDVLFSQPFGRRWMLEVEAPFYYYSGGWMDPVVSFWHHGFGLNNGNRQLFPDNSGELAIAHGTNRLGYQGDGGIGIGDLTLRGVRQLTPAAHGWPAVALSGAVKLPTGSVRKIQGSGCWDTGLGLHFTQQSGQSWFYGTLGYNFIGGWRGMPGVPTRNTVDTQFGYEYRVSPRWSCLAAFGLYDHPIETAEPKSVGSLATVVSLGARYTDQRNVEMEWGFVENIVRNSNTHDFGLYARVRFWPGQAERPPAPVSY